MNSPFSLRTALFGGALLALTATGHAQPDPLQNPAEVGPPSPAVGAKISEGYFGPMPSQIQKS